MAVLRIRGSLLRMVCTAATSDSSTCDIPHEWNMTSVVSHMSFGSFVLRCVSWMSYRKCYKSHTCRRMCCIMCLINVANNVSYDVSVNWHITSLISHVSSQRMCRIMSVQSCWQCVVWCVCYTTHHKSYESHVCERTLCLLKGVS